MDGSHAHPTGTFRDANDGALWPAQPVQQLPRGRQPRDALAKTVDFIVHSLDEFETTLRDYLNNPPEQPEHTEAQLSFWIGTSFMVSAPPQSSHSNATALQPPQQQQHVHAPPGYQPANGLTQHYGGPSHPFHGVHSVSDAAMALAMSGYPPTADASDSSTIAGKKAEPKVSLSIMEALQATTDPKEKMRKQRAIAKCCVDAIQRTDGYRYSFHNCWNSREDDSFRFSYYCNDSLLNKDRAANGKGAKLGKRATKPVYDCKGVLSIKFSATKQTLDVFYKHVPIHKTYEERAPPPRKDSKRRKYLEEHHPDALVRIVTRPKQQKDDSEDPEVQARPKKKKTVKPDTPKPSNTSLESDLRAQSLRSLLELIQVDPSPPEPTPPEPPPPPPPQPQQHLAPAVPLQQVPQQSAPQRRRPRNSCDVCKAKKTKVSCDGTRPVCQTCIDKKRPCFYSETTSNDEQRQQVEAHETVRQVLAANDGLSELDKMKRELEEAKARIQELESEKRASTTPIQTPQMATRPNSQPQPPPQPQTHHRNPHSQSQTDFAWPPAAYYGYQNTQQHQQDQWAAARESGVFR
ncbi:hypothetical protein EK21DRAFT_63660 [Setomelanomma holmii]|uniref:Zn(2)-C6 fungal-type domain-containing protein n=1 Tax=Setomelanomma holmii TaxID=210430 RepID=A0A9P4LLB5_9PLEO|nr:hypothetical protein EK21DRAFT_63660 [Setomelanomma holmii]